MVHIKAGPIASIVNKSIQGSHFPNSLELITVVQCIKVVLLQTKTTTDLCLCYQMKEIEDRFSKDFIIFWRKKILTDVHLAL